MAALTLTKSTPRHRVTVWTLERRLFDGFFERSSHGRHVARYSK